jgi:Domain of unknown function (DU1801).
MPEQKSKKLSGPDQVIHFLADLDHPYKREIEHVRQIILSADDQLTEHIKWNAPSFCVNGEDRITFNLHGKEGFRLIFHCGSKSVSRQDRGKLFDDPTHLLEWVTDDRAVVKLSSMDDVEAKKEKLLEVVSLWIKESKAD